jgi:signal transduction histidine kinase/CheY-like chemotaxis protein
MVGFIFLAITSMTVIANERKRSISAANKLKAHQIDTVFRNVAPSAIGSSLTAITIVIILYRLNSLNNVTGALWLLYMTATVLGVQFSLLYFYRKRAPDENSWKRWARAFTAMSVVEGCGWGWASVYLSAGHRIELEVLTASTILIIATGAIPSLATYFPAFLANFVPSSLPFAILCFVSTDPVLHATSLLMALFLGTMGALGFQASKHFTELVELRIRTSELAEDLRAQKELAEQINVAKSQFLATASHDLRQPVHAIGLFVGALRAVPLPDEGVRLLQQIDTSLAALDSLFGALLDMSRLEAGVVEVRMRAFAIQPIIDRIYNDFVSEAKAKGISIVRHPSSARVFSDPMLIERILRNLVSNAVRYTASGRVVIGCRRRGATLRVEVWDTGVGIPATHQERIFEEYFQLANPERDRQKGLGLGLAIVRRLAYLLECPLSFQSEPGRGSCFGLSIPLTREAAAPLDTEEEIESPTRGRGLLVVIDDEASIRDAMSTLLSGWGYSVITAESGDEILDKLATHPIRPELIICDYRLRANENGLDVIDRLRSEFNETIPALLITGDTARDRLAEAAASGLLLLHKPVANVKLRAAIVNLMAASRKVAA